MSWDLPVLTRWRLLLVLMFVVTGSCSPSSQGETIKLESLMSSEPEVFPSEVVLLRAGEGHRELGPDGDFESIELDANAIRFVAQPRPDVLSFVVPYRDRSGLCLFDASADGGGVGIACTTAEIFNTEGLWTATDGPDGYTVLLVPEGTEVGDIEDGVVHPSGVAVSFEGVREDVTLNNGRVGS